MQILKVIALLMDYPNAEVADARAELAMAISEAIEISPDHRSVLLASLEKIYTGDLMIAEEEYTGLFEQGRSLSLHLFEHVHGESRDRGQAMVDLMETYESHGFDIDAKELPDYLPLFLEYLSTRPELEAREWLADVSHILGLLGARLSERESHYLSLFEALTLIAGKPEAIAECQVDVKKEPADNTPEALDKEWEEAAVTFGADDQSCGEGGSPRPDTINPNTPQPIQVLPSSSGQYQSGAR